MSIKPVVFKSAASASAEIESPDLITTRARDRDTYIPPIDFSTASNFTRFGSGKEYYAESIKRIYSNYPYDGSEKEKLDFKLNSSYLDRWMLDTKYPRSTGYMDFNYNGHIVVNRGYEEATTPAASKLADLFNSKRVVYDSAKRRKQTFVLDFDDGFTFEWMMKKDAWNTTDHKEETIFELSEGASYIKLVLSASAEGTRPFNIAAHDGATTVALTDIGASTLLTSSVADNAWHHYAVSMIKSGANIKVNFYVDGISNEITNLASLNNIDGNITAFIGSGSYGLLDASVDEFRYWNKLQTSERINSYYDTSIGGGANSDDYRKELGVYYKFNEGTTLTTATDRVILDYSGRIANGYVENYVDAMRASGSAFSSEIGDPIIRSSHPEVTSLQAEMETSGSQHDTENSSYMYDMVPHWIRQEDEQNGEEFKKLVQVMSSYFDTLYSQIEHLPTLKDKKYLTSDYKAPPFASRLLEEKGFDVSDILTNRTLLEFVSDKDKNGNIYDKDIAEIKNLIYLNIYNNLEHIYKSKGTEKSYRNLLRCFGIDDELVKLNLYTDNATQYMVDKTKHTSQKTKHVNFDKPANFNATVYQENVISGSKDEVLERHLALTAEVEVLVPQKPEKNDSFYYGTSFLSSSVFGLDSVHSSLIALSSSNEDNFQLYLVRDSIESDRAQWVLEQKNEQDSLTSIALESPFYDEIYNNQRWNLAVRLYPEGYPFAGSFGDDETPSYTLELYGVSHNMDEVLHEFTVTTTLPYATGSGMLSADKKLYAGARRTNWTGSVETQSDVKVAAVSLYFDKLNDQSVKQHNLDPSNYGHNKVFGNPTLFATSQSGIHLPAQDSLALHWDFQTVTTSDGSGEFTVQDFSSGSATPTAKYDWLGEIVNNKHEGLGYGFPISSTDVVANEFIFASKKELPEISFTSDGITIMTNESEYLYEDEDVSDNIFSFEKSMYQSVSENMLNMFSTVVEYSNLFAKPIDRYRKDYKRLEHVRKIFFERVTGSMDLDRFTSYYKWIDQSVSHFLEQLHPASAKFNMGLSDMVESHILERPKYQHLFPTLETKTATEAGIKGGAELQYNWQYGHAPNYKLEDWGTKSIQVSSTGYLQHGSATAYSGTVSFSFWLGLSADTTTRTLVQVGTNRFIRAGNGLLEYVIKNSSGTDWVWQMGIDNDANTHVVIADDNTNTDGAVSMWENNGSPSDTGSEPRPSTHAGTRNNITTANFTIGVDSELDSFDEFSIWNKALTTADVTSIYNGNVAQDLLTHVSASNLVSFYRMGDHYLDPPDEPYKGLIIRDSKGLLDLDVKGVGSKYLGNIPSSFKINTDDSNLHCFWQKNRAERTGDREEIRTVLSTFRTETGPSLGDDDRTIYTGGTYALRNFTRPYALSATEQKTIHGGVNYSSPKDRDFIKPLVMIHGPTSTDGLPQNVIAVGAGQGQGIELPEPCLEETIAPSEKIKYNSAAIVGKFSNYDGSNAVTGSFIGATPVYAHKMKGHRILPFNIITGSEPNGYGKIITNLFDKQAILTNLHSDTTDLTNEIPMQGPFSNQWSGGHQSRHVPLNIGTDNAQSRPEAWKLLIGEHESLDIVDGAIGLVGNDYGEGYPDNTRPFAIHYRNGRAKRPMVIANIQYSTASQNVGNYQKNYEVLNTTGRKENNRVFKIHGDTFEYLTTTLSGSTNEITLLGVNPASAGNLNLNHEGGNRVSDTMRTSPSWDTGSNDTVIVSRFSSPGGVDTSHSFLDVYSKEYSPNNALPFRNLLVRGSGSGESTSMRVDSPASRREGLRTLYTRHSGRFGLDSIHGSVRTEDYYSEASYHKIHRNTSLRPLTSDLYRKAFRLPAGTEYITGLSSSANLDYPTTGGFSVTFWLKLDQNSSSDNRTIYMDAKDANQNSLVFVADDMRFRVESSTGTSAQYIQFAFEDKGQEASYADWTHVAVTYDGKLQTTGSATLYLNGSLTEAKTAPDLTRGGADFENDTRRNFTDGIVLFNQSDASVNTAELQGSMQDFAFWKKELSAAEVEEIFNNGNYLDLSTTSIEGEILDYWKLGEDSIFDVGGQVVGNVTAAHGTKKNTLVASGSLVVTNGLNQGILAGVRESHNNFHVQSTLPQSDYNYSWVTSSLGNNYSVRSGAQKVFGYWPKTGMLTSSAGFTEAISFPTTSEIQGS